MRLPTVFFAEGGGGRPGDTDYPTVSSLDTRAFKLWAQLSGVVPRIAIVKGRCFAGNAVIAGCSDLIVATEDASIGMGGPAMIAGGGLGDVHPDEVGPISVQEPNGVVDVVVADEAEAVAVTKRLLGYFQGTTARATAATKHRLRTMIPERDRRAYDVGPVITTLADEGSVTFLRPRFAREMVTALARIEGRAVGVIANDTRYMAGAITAAASDKAARFLQLCDCFRASRRVAHRLPGLHGRPGRRGRSAGAPRVQNARRGRRAARSARRGRAAPRIRPWRPGDDGRQPARAGADRGVAGRAPRPDGARGRGPAGLRKELEAIADDDEREERVRQATAAAQDNAKALNAAQLFEIDDVIDPADTRRLIAATLTAATAHAQRTPRRRFVDTW